MKFNEIETIRSIDQFFSFSLYYLPFRCSYTYYIAIIPSHSFRLNCTRVFAFISFALVQNVSTIASRKVISTVITMIQKYECGVESYACVRSFASSSTQTHNCLIHIQYTVFEDKREKEIQWVCFLPPPINFLSI